MRVTILYIFYCMSVLFLAGCYKRKHHSFSNLWYQLLELLCLSCIPALFCSACNTCAGNSLNYNFYFLTVKLCHRKMDSKKGTHQCIQFASITPVVIDDPEAAVSAFQLLFIPRPPLSDPLGLCELL